MSYMTVVPKSSSTANHILPFLEKIVVDLSRRPSEEDKMTQNIIYKELLLHTVQTNLVMPGNYIHINSHLFRLSMSSKTTIFPLPLSKSNKTTIFTKSMF